jgi:hypothetical protein
LITFHKNSYAKYHENPKHESLKICHIKTGRQMDREMDGWMDVVFTCDFLVVVQGECPEVTPLGTGLL